MTAAFRLVVEKGRSKGKSLRLKPTGQVVVGRDQQSGLVIQDPQASRKHFQLAAKLGEFTLEDLGSSNGTFVNGQRVTKKVLAAGDKVLLGETLVYFLEDRPEAEGGERKGELSGREVGGYRIGRLLGRGGMGTVYEAVQLSLERVVAWKSLAPELAADPTFVQRFVAEARAAGALSHANLVAVFDVGQEDGLRYYSMEYMPGGSVEDLLRKEGKLELARVLRIAFDAARGLEFAERQGLIHRDIKPDNLMLAADGTAKICDLGIATRVVPGQGAEEVSGSPLYIAPEHALGKPIDHRVDLYGLGVTMYQLLSGEPPFQKSSAREIILAHINEPPPPLQERAAHLPADAVDLVMRLLAKDPAGRPKDARQVQADLLELARRHALPEDLLRLEAVAAPDLPPAQLLPAAPRGSSELAAAGPARRAPAWVAVGLILLGVLLASAFAARAHLAGLAADERAELDRELARVEELIGRSLHAEAEAVARELAARHRAEGREADAVVAEALAAKAEQGRLVAEEELARMRLEAATRLAEQWGKADPGDPAVAQRLDEVARQLERLRQDHPSTAAAREAERLQGQVLGQLARARLQREETNQREAAARERLRLAKESIDRLLGLEARKDRFSAALEHVRAYQRDHAELAERPAQVLRQSIHERARKTVEAALARAGGLAAQGKFAEARAELDPVEGLGLEELDRRVAETAEALAAAEARARADAAEAAVRLELDRLGRAVAELGPLRAARRFGEAARRLEAEGLSSRLEHPAARRRLQTRLSCLNRAEEALGLLADAVRAGRRVQLRLERGRAVSATEVDARGRVYTTSGGREVPLDDPGWSAASLLQSVRPQARTAFERFQVACLAVELEQREEAKELLLELSSEDATLRERAGELLELLEAP